MNDEKIEVEWIATAQQMLSTIQKIDQKMTKQEQLMQKLGDTSKKSAEGAVGSFNKLEKELKDNEAQLKRLAIGTKEFDDQKKKVDMLRGSLARVKGEISGIQSGAATFAGIKTSMLAGAAAGGSLVAMLKKVADAQREIVNTGADAALTIDTMARQLQIQASLTDPERKEASRQVMEQSTKAGVTADVGFRTATQLVSSGFQKPIESGSLTAAIEAMQATNFKGSPEEFIQGMSEVLASYKLDKTADNLQNVAVAMQGLFKQTDFQLVEGADFAKQASVFQAAGLSLTQSFATFAAAREVLPAAEAGTGVRNLTTILQGAGAKKPQTEALKSIGIKPEEVDFIGEDMVQVLSRLNKGMKGVDEQTKQLAMIQLFGRENIAVATLLSADKSIERIKELETLQGNKDQFRTDVETAQGGMQAGRNRIENEALARLVPKGEGLEDLRSKMKSRDDQLSDLETTAALQSPVRAAAVRSSGAIATTIDDATGLDLTGMALRGPSATQKLGIGALSPQAVVASKLLMWLTSSDTKQDELIRLQKEANAMAAAKQPQGAQPAAPQRAAVPAVRPREAALPGATVP